MIRDYDQIYRELQIAEQNIKAGHPAAIQVVIPQMMDLLDTLRDHSDNIIRVPQGSIIQLQGDNRILRDQVNMLTHQHNLTQETMRKMGTEIDKFHKIFDFLVSQKNPKEVTDHESEVSETSPED
jgi:hypothetical protein